MPFAQNSSTFPPAELTSYLPKFISRTNICGISVEGRESNETILPIRGSQLVIRTITARCTRDEMCNFTWKNWHARRPAMPML